MASYLQRPLGVNHIPNFLRASTPSGLRRLILRNNTRLKGFVNYMGSPTYVAEENSWYIWYYVTDEEGLFQEAVEGVE